MPTWSSKSSIIIRTLVRNTFLKSFFAKFLYGNRYEEKFSRSLLNHLWPNDIVWDVGANIGLYSIEFAKALNPDGEIYSFEPVPEVFTQLKENTVVNPRINCFNLALSEMTGLSFMEKGQDPLLATSKIVDIQGESSISIQTMTGDEFLRLRYGSNPTFLKIDVEGHELSVLKGLSETLRTKPPRIIGIEIHFEKMSQGGNKFGPQEIMRILQSKYLINWVDPSHVVCVLRERDLVN